MNKFNTNKTIITYNPHFYIMSLRKKKNLIEIIQTPMKQDEKIIINDNKIHPIQRYSDSNKSKKTSKDDVEPSSKKISNPDVLNTRMRASYRDNLLGSNINNRGSGAEARNSKLMEAKLKDRRKSSKRSGIKRNNYLPRHIEGKYSVEEVRFLKDKLKKNDTLCALISCCALVIAWIEAEIFFTYNNVSGLENHILRGIVSGSCLVSHFFIFQHYKLELEILKSRKIIYQGTSMLKSSLFPRYFIESVYNWVHCPPYLDSHFTSEQLGIKFDLSVNAYLSVIMLGRLYIFFRLFDHYTFWTGERAIRVCRINGFLPDSKFAIKAYLRYKSVLVLTLSLGLSILLFGFALRTFERPFTNDQRPQQFNNIMNAFWCVVVTMATIGYGDIYPITFFGRIVIIISCIWGIFILSLFVVSLNNITQLTKEENKAYEDISREDKVKSTLQRDAAKIIIILFKLNLSRKKKSNIRKRILMRMDLMGIANRFRIKRKNVLNETKSIQEILGDLHLDVNRDIEELMETIQPLNNSTPLIKDAEELQGIINEKTLQVYENSKRLMNVIAKMNKGRIHAESFDQIEPLFEKQNQQVSLGEHISYFHGENEVK